MATMVPTMPPLVSTVFPFCSSFEHFLLLLLLALHGHEQEEIEDRKNEQDGHKAHQGVGGRLQQKQIQKH